MKDGFFYEELKFGAKEQVAVDLDRIAGVATDRAAANEVS